MTVHEAPRISHSEAIRRQWLIRLAVITSPAFAADATKALVTYVDLLDDWPDEIFMPPKANRTLAAVASAPRRQTVPAFDEVERALGEWWRANRPPQFALAGPAPVPEPDREPPSEEECRHVEHLVAEFQAEIASRAQRAGIVGRRRERSAPLPVIDVLEQPTDDPEVQAARAALAQRRNHAAGEYRAGKSTLEYGSCPTELDLANMQ